jgi:hypothetical protein
MSCLPEGVSLLQFAVMILQDPSGSDDEAGYDTIAIRNIGRIEELRNQRSV